MARKWIMCAGCVKSQVFFIISSVFTFLYANLNIGKANIWVYKSLIALLLLLTCCSSHRPTSGSMQGIIISSAQKVSIQYKKLDQSTWLTLYMPDGSVFQGRVIHSGRILKTDTMTGLRMDGAVVGRSRNAARTGFLKNGKRSEHTSGKMSGKLIADDGLLMECNLQYADASGDPSYGGFGVCITGDTKVDISW
ncbi:hypothetical protein [Candidatus Lariskella endosymbiont of Epinotia ramella]|uniref:hypothetical protein n=1 Tax=Candidatus Lariskella endosymbiont of Epinotia ramella TaxID=3066224 RepID=UPI0030D34889